jgi:hypothetical protein
VFLGNLETPKLSVIKRRVETDLPREIVRYWKQQVIDDLSEKPFSREELKTLELKEGVNARRKVVSYPILAYGATLLSVVVTQRYILYLQIGDGDILIISDHGQVKRPLETEEWFFANETTSLCLPQAWQDFKVSIQAITDQLPALILLSTDGYSDSFTGDEDFLQIGPDILEVIRSGGLERVNDHLMAWLDETSQLGSGDDITLGIVCRTDVFEKKEELLGGGRPPESAGEGQNKNSQGAMKS